MTFGEKLKLLRTEKGWSQEELAAKIGKNKRTVFRYEAGDCYPRERELYSRLAALLEVDVNYLLTENEEFLSQAGRDYGRRGELQAEAILAQTRELFAGGTLAEEDKLAFLTEMQRIFLDSKETARDKFAPKKRRRG